MVASSQTVELQCPAKINLSLAIHGKRTDGFHDLHSVVAQTTFGDVLRLEWNPDGPEEDDRVFFSGAVIPESDNTVKSALLAFRRASGLQSGVFVARVRKRIPTGAGLGGGSSDAVGCLRALRQIHGRAYPELDWVGMSAEIGSDCPLFWEEGPVVMEGRGERIHPMPEPLAKRLRGRRVMLFKPRFEIVTAEAYGRLSASGRYADSGASTHLMEAWEASGTVLPPAMNSFEELLADWMPSLPIVLQRLRQLHGLEARLSGSGSACFAFPANGPDARNCVAGELVRAWGVDCFLEETTVK